MRPSRRQTKIDYDEIFQSALRLGGEWVEIEPVKWMTREEYAADLRAAANARDLHLDMVWADQGWMMIRKIGAAGNIKLGS
jgi:hypothetical protein